MTTDNNNTVETTPAVEVATVAAPEVSVAPVAEMPAAPMINIDAALGNVDHEAHDISLNTETLAHVESDAPAGPVLHADVVAAYEAPVIGATHEDTVVCETSVNVEDVAEVTPKAKKAKAKKEFNVPVMIRSALDLSHDAMRAAFTPFKSSLARMLETSNNASIGNWLGGTNKLPDNYLEVVAAKTNTTLVTIMVPVDEVAELEEKFAGYNDAAIAQFVNLLDQDANAKTIAKQKKEEEAAAKKKEREEKAAAAAEEKAKRKAEREAKAAAAAEEKAKKKAEREAKAAAKKAEKEAAKEAAKVATPAVSEEAIAQANSIVVDAPVAEATVDIEALVAE